jgi:transposase-like protein
MAKHRTHSIEFKRQIAQEFLAGETLHGLAKRHDICRNLIRVWVQKYEPATLTKTQPLPIGSSNTKPGSRRWNGLSAGKRWSSSF